MLAAGDGAMLTFGTTRRFAHLFTHDDADVRKNITY